MKTHLFDTLSSTAAGVTQEVIRYPLVTDGNSLLLHLLAQRRQVLFRLSSCEAVQVTQPSCKVRHRILSSLSMNTHLFDSAITQFIRYVVVTLISRRFRAFECMSSRNKFRRVPPERTSKITTRL